MSCYLFDSWSFRLPLPEPFDKVSSKSFPVLSKYTTSGATSTLHGPTLRAMLLYWQLMDDKTPGNVLGDRIALGTKDNDRFYIAELLPGGKSTHCRLVVHDTENGTVYGAKVDVKTDAQESYQLGPEAGNNSGYKDDGTAILFALMPEFLKDDEFKERFDSLRQTVGNTTIAGTNDLSQHAAVCCDNIYRRMIDAGCPAYVKNNLSANLAKLTPMAVSTGVYAPDVVLAGDFSYLVQSNGAAGGQQIPAVATSAFVGKYQLDPQRELSDEEKALVPELASWYVIPKQVVDVCNHAKATTGGIVEMRNFLLRGPAGTGKTEGAKAIAAGLGMPYMKYTCSANSEIYDFIGQVIPIMDGDKANPTPVSGGDMAESLGLPSFMEIRNDPETAYAAITGVQKDGVEPEECYRAAVSRVSEKMQALTGTQQYRYVETPFIRALECGYVVEIQEPTVITSGPERSKMVGCQHGQQRAHRKRKGRL